MQWLYWHKSEPRKLPAKIIQSLKVQFALDDHILGKMRCYVRMGSFANRRAEYSRVFDPGLIQAGEPAPTSYDSFALTDPRRNALLFEGHLSAFDIPSRIMLTDRRSVP